MDSLFDSFKSNYTKDSYRIMCTVSAAVKETFFYVQEIGYLDVIKPYNTIRDNLDSFLFVIVLDGKGELVYNNRTYTLTKVCCFLIDCLKPHSYKSSLSEPWKLLWLHFNGPTARGYYEYFANAYINVIHPEISDPFEDIMRQLIEINTRHDASTEVRSSRLIVELLTLMMTFKKNDTVYTSQIVRKLAEIRRYINRNYTTDIYLETICEKFSISKFHLTKEFKKAYGITIAKYIMQKRIGNAKWLLKYSDKTLEEISEACGFYDTCYFNKQFKAIEATTPYKYRKAWLEKDMEIKTDEDE